MVEHSCLECLAGVSIELIDSIVNRTPARHSCTHIRARTPTRTRTRAHTHAHKRAPQKQIETFLVFRDKRSGQGAQSLRRFSEAQCLFCSHVCANKHMVRRGKKYIPTA